MKNYIIHDEWKIIEDKFHPEHNEITESLMSLGNGRMGQRGNFEETYTGHSLQGNYVAGVWYPDKTKVGWWKNGYPDYFAKVINACNWLGIKLKVDGIEIDLNTCKIISFYRELNMKNAVLSRNCILEIALGKQISINSERFCSMAHDESAAIRYEVSPLNFDANIEFTIDLDGDVSNKDANHGEKFWNEISKSTDANAQYITLETKKSVWNTVPTFQVCTGMNYLVTIDGETQNISAEEIINEKYIGSKFNIKVKANSKLTLYKYAVNLSSENHKTADLEINAKKYISNISNIGFENLKKAQTEAWAEKWNRNDIKIDGDIGAQQGIRFNIFHLQQTYTGQDARLNIGPKGFTGEKYGGVTYWDTEAYCLPFYQAVADQSVARNLLVYRHNHLQKAIENAQKLGFKNGAALYPMVTMNGEECHNEWEITFEEIHRNGAIAYAIYDYINYTGDSNYLNTHGLEVLIGISRFWAQRVNWSENHKKYVMLGVTGPNEYENNVNNNWYTNYLAVWTLKYTIENIQKLKNTEDWNRISKLTKFQFESEIANWRHITENMYFPYDAERNVFLQQDGFLDKELISADKIENRPINQNWSWDRILRSCFIKQADVLQGFYFFENDFSEEQLRSNFDFYEPMTVHESSLSPCVHSILACKLGKIEKAYEMYVRTSRLDLDDYNNDTEDGLHITSMAGTWMSLVKGFGGMRVNNSVMSLNPVLPANWKSISFRVGIKDVLFEVFASENQIKVKNLSNLKAKILIRNKEYSVSANSEIVI